MSDSLRPPWTATHQASLSFIIFQSLPKFVSIGLMMLFNHLILCCPLHFLPSVFPSIRVFSSESTVRIKWPKYWSFGFSISPSSEYSGLISYRIDWFDLLADQGTFSVMRAYGKESFVHSPNSEEIGSDGKASVYSAGDLGLIPGSGRFPGEGNGNPLQYSCLENPMDGGAWCKLLSMGSQRDGHD